MLNSTDHEIPTAYNYYNTDKIKKFIALSLSYVVFKMLINVKMPTNIDSLIFMSRINFVFS